jgi:uncharacterized protein (TIGR03067 family)
MRIFSFFFMALLCVACSNTKIENKLNGTWKPIAQEMGGTPFPQEVLDKQQLIISDSNYTVIAESVDKGVVKVNGDKLDVYGKEGVNAGKHFTALYKFEKDQLTVCYNLAGDKYPESFDTKDKPMYFLSVFKKQEEK